MKTDSWIFQLAEGTWVDRFGLYCVLWLIGEPLQFKRLTHEFAKEAGESFLVSYYTLTQDEGFDPEEHAIRTSLTWRRLVLGQNVNAYRVRARECLTTFTVLVEVCPCCVTETDGVPTHVSK